MRELRFRAWDEQTETMYYSDRDYEECTFICESEGHLKCYVPEEVPATLDEPSHVVGREIFEIMQWTGLKDKNGRDIYQGDKDKDNGIVIWNTDDASFSVEYKGIETQSMMDAEMWFEVIGNIHDTPEVQK